MQRGPSTSLESNEATLAGADGADSAGRGQPGGEEKLSWRKSRELHEQARWLPGGGAPGQKERNDYARGRLGLGAGCGAHTNAFPQENLSLGPRVIKYALPSLSSILPSILILSKFHHALAKKLQKEEKQRMDFIM